MDEFHLQMFRAAEYKSTPHFSDFLSLKTLNYSPPLPGCAALCVAVPVSSAGLQYGIPFYLQYLAHWPEYFIVAEAPGGELMGYSKCSLELCCSTLRRGCCSIMSLSLWSVMGKAEGSVAREEWHGHVTALSVAPEFRRLGLAAKLMEMLEEISER